MARNRKRKIVIVLGTLVLSVLLVVVALPLWFPWVAERLAPRYGVQFSGYQRHGYSRLAFSEVSYQSTNATFTAERVELFQPTVWLWKHYVSRSSTGEFAVVTSWTLDFDRAAGTGRKKATPPQVMLRVDSAVRELRRWLPNASFTNGLVRYEAQELGVPSLTWRNGAISASLISQQHQQTGTLEADLAGLPKTGTIHWQDVSLKVALASDKQRLRANGFISWLTNRAEVSAEFVGSWIPANAILKSDHFRIPAEYLRLEGYQDLVGAVSAVWSSNRYTIKAEAEAKPEATTQLPPVNLVVNASGTTNRIRFETVEASMPWLNASLSSGVEFDYHGRLLSPAAAITVDADLGKQQMVDAKGRFTGEAFLTRSRKKYPFADFKLSSTGFEGYGMHLRHLDIGGTLDWPVLDVRHARLVFTNDATGEAQTRVNMVSRTFENGLLKLRGPLGREFLPPQISYTNISADVTFNGPLRVPEHSGNVTIVGLTLPNLNPLSVSAKWTGHFREIKDFTLEANTSNAGIKAAGSATVQSNAVALNLSTMSIATHGTEELTLEIPATVRIAKKDIEATRIALRDGTRELSVGGKLSWPESGDIAITARNVSVRDFQPFFQDRLSHLDVDELHASGSWTNGPIDFVVRATGQFTPVETNQLAVKINAAGDEKGISFEDLSVLSEDGPVLNGRGFFPVQLAPANSTNKVQLLKDQLIDFRLDTAPNAAFWDRIAGWTHVRLKHPEVHAVISGTLEQPQGNIVAQVAEASWDKKGLRIPNLTRLRAEMQLTEQMLRLKRLEMLIENQPLTLQAKLPLGDLSQSWQDVLDWRKASGRVRARNVELAPFRKYIPDILAPQGQLDVDIAFQPGMQLDGWLLVDNAATRPLPGSGPLQDLQARLRFTNHVVQLKDVHGLLGGQPVGIFGMIDFSKTRNNLPLMDLSLLGQSVPLARRPEAIIRGDLKLKLSNLTNDVPVVFGDVTLRDSYYLGDIKQLVPGRVASPKRRPPYFSVDVEPLNEWLANVRVAGENFLNVRSPLFRGKISANWRITGTLGEPVALGDAEIESGIAQFPFANFQVTRGYMTLTSEDPYRPEIFATATSRAFGYDLQMILTGPAHQPVLEFSSTPALTSEQIIAMVTTGEVPNRTFGFSQQQRAQRLALFLGRSLISKFSDPAGAERLTISTGEEISEQGRETYGLEYKITDDWSIVGEYDRFGAVNAGVKWRIYSK